MNTSQLLDLIASDMRRNRGLHLDALRAKLLLLEIRVEQFVFVKTHSGGSRALEPFWYPVRFMGSIFQWLLCTSHIAGSVKIGRGLRLPHPQNIVVVGTATIGEFATIYQNVSIAWNGFDGTPTVERSPRIGRCVLIGAGAIILGDVTVGDFVLIGAGTVVTRSIPSYSRVTGVPPNVTPRATSDQAPRPGSKQHLEDPYSIYR